MRPGDEAMNPTLLAKAALRRLALARLEPTPQNYASAWADEGGALAPCWPERALPVLERLVLRASDDGTQRAALLAALSDGHWDEARQLLERGSSGPGWAALIERAVRGLERGGRLWTQARRRDSLQRVLDGSGLDPARLQQRLQALLTAWDQDREDEAVDTGIAALVEAPPLPEAAGPASARPAAMAGGDAGATALAALAAALHAALPAADARAAALAAALAAQVERLAAEGPTPALAAELGAVCAQAGRWLEHRQQFVIQLETLCRELTAGLVDLAEDASWTQGQLRAIEARLDGGLSARGIKAATELLARTREQQQHLRGERDRAREALRALVLGVLAQLGEVDDSAGGYGQRLEDYDRQIGSAASIDELAGVVQRMLADNRAVRAGVQATRERLGSEHARATELEARVRALEDDLRRLADEVSTDALTEVANRRGLQQAFDAERARIERAAPGGLPALAVGLIDIDNFKRLNDTLGHAAGDLALKTLATRVAAALRPSDTVGRWGGEEFVVLLPATTAPEAQQVLTRLQRGLSAGLFLHEGREVFVTFSAGVTGWLPGESLDSALERADEALFEAKRSGKNRCCVG